MDWNCMRLVFGIPLKHIANPRAPLHFQPSCSPVFQLLQSGEPPTPATSIPVDHYQEDPHDSFFLCRENSHRRSSSPRLPVHRRPPSLLLRPSSLSSGLRDLTAFFPATLPSSIAAVAKRKYRQPSSSLFLVCRRSTKDPTSCVSLLPRSSSSSSVSTLLHFVCCSSFLSSRLLLPHPRLSSQEEYFPANLHFSGGSRPPPSTVPWWQVVVVEHIHIGCCKVGLIDRNRSIMLFVCFPACFHVFRQGQPPPATLAMVAGGGGRTHVLRLLLDQSITTRNRYMLRL